MENTRKKSIPLLIFKILFQGIVAFGISWAWAVGIIIIALSGAAKNGINPLCLTAFMLGLLCCSFGCIFSKRRIRRFSYCIMGLSVVVCCAMAGYKWWTVERFPVVKHEVDWWEYRPTQDNDKLAKVIVPDEYALSADEGYPHIDGAYALYPIYAAMAREMYPEAYATSRNYLLTNGSDRIYKELLYGERDLIFALAPSKQQEEEAEKRGLTYELTPFCMDAFVFYVNAKNPIDNLTTEQIRGIYSGEITNWKEIGLPEDVKIIPFQRNEGSGSQTTLQKLMGDTPIMPPIKEDRVGGMGEIINDTANYRNFKAAIGFSFRYYAMEMLRNKQIKLLSINGVAPTVENIRNGSYPLVATAYMVTVLPRSANTRKIVDFMCSPAGHELVEKTGYVPVNGSQAQETEVAK